jgi:hypothetical protein
MLGVNFIQIEYARVYRSWTVSDEKGTTKLKKTDEAVSDGF